MDFGQSFDLQTTMARRKKMILSQKDYQKRQPIDIRTEKFSQSSGHLCLREGLESQKRNPLTIPLRYLIKA